MKKSDLPSPQSTIKKETRDRIKFEELIKTNIPDRNANDEGMKPFSDFFVNFFNLSIVIGDKDDIKNYTITRSTLNNKKSKTNFFKQLFEHKAEKFYELFEKARSENDHAFEDFFNHYLDFIIEKLTNEYKELKQKKERGEEVKDPEDFLEFRKFFFKYILTKTDDLKAIFLENQRFCEEPLLKSCLVDYHDIHDKNTTEQSADDISQRDRIAQLEQELERTKSFVAEKDKIIQAFQKKIDDIETTKDTKNLSNSSGFREAYIKTLDDNTKLKKELNKIQFELESNQTTFDQITQENSRLIETNCVLTQENSRLQEQVNSQHKVASEPQFNLDQQQEIDSIKEKSEERLIIAQRTLLKLQETKEENIYLKNILQKLEVKNRRSETRASILLKMIIKSKKNQSTGSLSEEAPNIGQDLKLGDISISGDKKTHLLPVNTGETYPLPHGIGADIDISPSFDQAPADPFCPPATQNTSDDEKKDPTTNPIYVSVLPIGILRNADSTNLSSSKKTKRVSFPGDVAD